MHLERMDYETDEKWSDVVPIPQDEGSENPIAAIAYTDEYAQATCYLRAVMASNEMSPRVMELTEHIINMNPAHYTVWLYRAENIKALAIDPLEELNWLEDISMKHLKNFQIWGYRQSIMTMINELPPKEIQFLARILAKDAKNYHVWAYRQWLVEHFSLWPTAESKGSELFFIESLLANDVRNNSAWNHRFFVLFGRRIDHAIPSAIFDQEIQYTKTSIDMAPQNAAAWNYLRGVLRKQGNGMKDLEEFASSYASVEEGAKVYSSHAMDLLADIWASEGSIDKAHKALDLLADKYDPVRANYWSYRKGLISSKTEPFSLPVDGLKV